MSAHSRTSSFTHELISSLMYLDNKVITCINNQIKNPCQ